MKHLAASTSPLLAFATSALLPRAVTVVLPAMFSLSSDEAVDSSVVKEPIEEDRLSELAWEKMEEEVAELRLVVDDREEGRANGSDADAHEGEEADEEDAESLVLRGGEIIEPRRDGVGARVTVLPDEVEALSA